MINVIFVLFSTLFLFHLNSSEHAFVPGEYVIKLNPQEKSFLKTSESVSTDGAWKLLRVEDNKDLLNSFKMNEAQSVLSVLKNIPGVLFVEPNYIYSIPEKNIENIKSIPNDPSYDQLWGMKAIEAEEAWKISKDSGDIVIAVIDSGVDYTHEDLVDNMWSREVDGKIIHGFNAINDSLDPKDDNGHGTHCAGTIGAMGDNSKGVVGVNWKSKIMGIKFLSSRGSGSLDDAIQAIDWAVENGADILSNSWGGGAYSEALKEAIERARDAGVLFIAAAGNDSSNNDDEAAYPASYDLSNVISVGALNIENNLADFSNFGKETVHIAAPGKDIFSTYIEKFFFGSLYKKLSGTSMACPHVSGAAALYWANNRSSSLDEVKEALFKSSNKNDHLSEKIANDGATLNLRKLMTGSF